MPKLCKYVTTKSNLITSRGIHPIIKRNIIIIFLTPQTNLTSKYYLILSLQQSVLIVLIKLPSPPHTSIDRAEGLQENAKFKFQVREILDQLGARKLVQVAI